jgi:hypothetical protein
VQHKHDGLRCHADSSGHTHTTTEICTAWANSVRNALHNSNLAGVTPAPSGCETKAPRVASAIANWLRYAAEAHGEAAEGERQAQQAAYEQLRTEVKKAWNYEIPVLSELQPYLDEAIDTTVCTIAIAVYVKSKGKAAKVFGFNQWVANIGCGTAILALEIDDSGGDPGTRDDNGGSGGGAGAGTPEQTPTTTPQMPTTTPQTPEQAWNDAMNKYVNGKLSRAGLQAAVDAYQCSQGVQSKCR